MEEPTIAPPFFITLKKAHMVFVKRFKRQVRIWLTNIVFMIQTIILL
jgi:hypothetical protein